MDSLVNYDGASGENFPYKDTRDRLSTREQSLKPSLPDIPIVSIAVKGAGSRSTSGQHTPPASSSGLTDKKTPAKIQMLTKHPLPQRPTASSVPSPKSQVSSSMLTVRGASNAVPQKDLLKTSAPDVEDGEEGEVEEGETVIAKEVQVGLPEVFVTQATSEQSIQLSATSTSASLEAQPSQSTDHKPQKGDSRRDERWVDSPPRPRRSNEGRDRIKWDDTVEKAENRKISGGIGRDEPPQRSRSRGSSGRSELARSPTGSFSRPAQVANAVTHQSENGDRPFGQSDPWRSSGDDAPRRSQPYNRPRQRSREDDSYHLDRREPPRRRGLDYEATEDASMDTSDYRGYRPESNSYRYDRQEHRNERYPSQRGPNRNFNYEGLRDTWTADDEPNEYGSYHQSHAYDRRPPPSQEQPKGRWPAYKDSSQQQTQRSTSFDSNRKSSWDDGIASQSSRAARGDDAGWNRQPERNSDQRGWRVAQSNSHPEPRSNAWPASSGETAAGFARHRKQGDHPPGKGHSAQRNGTARDQAEEYRHLSPRPDQRALPPSRENHKALKRSGSATLSPNEQSQNGSRSKKPKVEVEPSSPRTKADVIMHSAEARVPSPPRDTPPEPPAEENIPPPPPFEPSVSEPNATSIEADMQLDDPPKVTQAEIVTHAEDDSIRRPGNAMPAVAVLPEPTVTDPLSVVGHSAEAESSGLQVLANTQEAPLRTVSSFKASSPMRDPMKSPTPPQWSPNLPAALPGTVWKGNSPLPGQASPKVPSITMEDMSIPSRAPTPNPNLTFSFLDYHTPAHSGSNTPLVNKTFFIRKKGERLDPKDDEAAYDRELLGVTKLDDFDMPTGNDKKEATLGKGTFGVVTRATRKKDNRVVALKLLQPPEEAKGQGKAGVLGTTVREIKILKLLKHENVVPLLDIVIERDQTNRLVKLYALQLLEGVAYMHHLKLIFDMCGTPEQDYVRYQTSLVHKEVINDNQGTDSRKTIPVAEMASPVRKRVIRDDSRYQHAKAEFKELLDKFLQVNPAKRISAADALNDRYFWVAPGPLPRSEVAHLKASKERRDQQEEAEAKERTREIERVQQAQANIQAHMINNSVLASMQQPRPHIQQPPTQLPPQSFPMRNTNPYSQPAPNFYPQANMVHSIPPNTMPYPNNGSGAAPAMNPYAPSMSGAYPLHAVPRQNGGGRAV
ncbi:hypothetical protein QFC19_002002 [Naganishia cerealis]|uniref:Uncharacterized protein n=1 Tax=Naganishia cerealis TaxID=610337 RepID=A0ACC2WGV5_9TREE|nr:hypothetical protein QFC19_002002 [Naganishia cerealis]